MMLPIHEVPKSIKKNSDGKKRERTLTTKWLFRVLEEANWNPLTTEGKYVVHEEVTGLAGRVDVALKAGKRVLACIELKAPNVEIDEFALKQAVKYASSYYYVNEGKLDPVLAICSNGLEAYIMDPAIENPHLPINAFRLSLDNEEGVKKLIEILDKNNLDRDSGELPIIKTQRKLDSRPYASNTTEAFEASIFKMAKDLGELGYSATAAVSMTIQVLLLAAARDNGIIPNAVIRSCEASEDWSALAKHCNKLFGNVFEPELTGKKAKHIWALYNRTSSFQVRLDILPAQYMGTIYEKLIKKFFGNKTSFYTPEDMIDTVLSECKPTVEDSILDPTCGSGAFLSKAIDFAIGRKVSAEKFLKFFNKVVGVDKDPIACKIAKVTLLCTFMRKVGEEYRRTGRPLPSPNIQPHIDFFDWAGGKFSLILGNPPWETIDELPAERKKQISKPGAFQVYEARNDVLCYILEKAIKRHLLPEGRFGFVIKLQALSGTSYKKFVDFLNYKVRLIVDYGRDQRFANYAQSASVVGSLSEAKWSYVHVVPETIAVFKGQHEYFRDRYSITQGGKSSADPVYRQFALENPTSECVKSHPTNLTLGGPAGQLIPMAYFMGSNTPSDFKNWIDRNKALKEKLLNRWDVKIGGGAKLAWTRDNSQELKGPILITERNLTPGNTKFPFMIDSQRSYLPTGGQSCIGSNQASLEEIRFFGSLLLSDYFIPLCRTSKLVPRRAGGIFLNPQLVMARLLIPKVSSIHFQQLVNTMGLIESHNRPATEKEISFINNIFSYYLSLGEQTNAAEAYKNQSLISYLMPEEVEDIDQSATKDDHLKVLAKVKSAKGRRGLKKNESKAIKIRNVLEKAKAGKKKTSKGRPRKKANR